MDRRPRDRLCRCGPACHLRDHRATGGIHRDHSEGGQRRWPDRCRVCPRADRVPHSQLVIDALDSAREGSRCSAGSRATHGARRTGFPMTAPPVVGESRSGSLSKAYRWTASGGMVGAWPDHRRHPPLRDGCQRQRREDRGVRPVLIAALLQAVHVDTGHGHRAAHVRWRGPRGHAGWARHNREQWDRIPLERRTPVAGRSSRLGSEFPGPGHQRGWICDRGLLGAIWRTDRVRDHRISLDRGDRLSASPLAPGWHSRRGVRGVRRRIDHRRTQFTRPHAVGPRREEP
jgi:hypothetical protein